ncbi:hypothetical protein [Nitrobacter winogradskyi]|uniref:Uncharacterized protein n=1 Tax=Nitrobacter winogradskyi TaxID=913 RepID=A0ACC6AFL5_NITWI|nr:hypothetical protein [Nitrobacter winogradskyi]MCP1998632.1 hypothetical protein [Nitrobacter winogradskyi]
MIDIFEYWKDVDPRTLVHPEDRPFFDSNKHRLCLSCLPVPYYGPLKTAKIVLLYLNPGLTQRDIVAASDPTEQDFFWRQRQGYEYLRDQEGRKEKSWWFLRTKYFGLETEFIRKNLAVVQLCAYHSQSFKDWSLLTKLPSCKVAFEWTQNFLIPQAKRGERIVVCLRSPKYWGLEAGRKYEGQLFSPKTTRQGLALLSERAELVPAIKAFFADESRRLPDRLDRTRESK